MRLKIAVIGTGSMGMNHLRVLRDFNEEQIQLVGIAETYEPKLKRAMNRFYVAGYTDYHQMVEETQPDLVAVVVPTYLHFEVASYLLDRGINVLIEKPMTSTIEEALALIQLAHIRGAKLAVGHIERFNPAVIEVKRRLVTSEPGQIFHLHARRLGPFPPRIRDVGVTLDLIATPLNDRIPTVSGEDGVAVLKVVLQLTEPTYREGVKKQGAKVALEGGVEVEA